MGARRRRPTDYFREPAARHAWLTIPGRLSAGRTLSEAQAEIDVLARDLDRRHPGQHTRIRVTGGAIIHEPETARSMPMVMAFCLGTTAVILLLVCANVTTLLLARAVARRDATCLVPHGLPRILLDDRRPPALIPFNLTR